MADFPAIHPDKCPFCGGDLKLVTGKYLWDYRYQCGRCSKKYHFKDGNIPDIKAVYQTEEYINKKAYEDRLKRSNEEFYANFSNDFISSLSSSGSTSASGVSSSNTGFRPYTCKRFYDSYEGSRRVEAEENLQRYLNNNRITRDRIVSISSGAYASQYGGLVIITLVHY